MKEVITMHRCFLAALTAAMLAAAPALADRSYDVFDAFTVEEAMEHIEEGTKIFIEGAMLQTDSSGTLTATINLNRIDSMTFLLQLDNPSAADGLTYANITAIAIEPTTKMDSWHVHVTDIDPYIYDICQYSANNGSWSEVMRAGDSITGTGGKVEETGTYDDGRHYALVRFDKFDYYAIITDEKTFFKGDIVDIAGDFSRREIVRHSSKSWDVSVIVYMDNMTATLVQ